MSSDFSESDFSSSDEDLPVESKTGFTIVSSDGSESEDELPDAFVKDLEFVQCLSNPGYLCYLYQQKFFEDEAFLNYIKYLNYWHDPQYAKYISYPDSLIFLRAIQNSEFVSHLSDGWFINFIRFQKHEFHFLYKKNRTDISIPEVSVKTH